MKSKYDRELLESRVKECFSWAGVCRLYGLRQNGGSLSLLKKIATNYGIDFSHFTGRRHNKGKIYVRKDSSEYLVKRDDGIRTSGQLLRKALINSGVPDLCAECGQGPWFNGKPLTLQTDHKDADYTNNTPENLRLLCPNCHSQTDTFCGRTKARNRLPAMS